MQTVRRKAKLAFFMVTCMICSIQRVFLKTNELQLGGTQKTCQPVPRAHQRPESREDAAESCDDEDRAETWKEVRVSKHLRKR